MSNDNNILPPGYTAQKNLDTIDLIGMTLTNASMGAPLDQQTLAACARLLSAVRVYAEVRDNLSPEVNPELIDRIMQGADALKRRPSPSEVAEMILRDLDQD